MSIPLIKATELLNETVCRFCVGSFIIGNRLGSNQLVNTAGKFKTVSNDDWIAARMDEWIAVELAGWMGSWMDETKESRIICSGANISLTLLVELQSREISSEIWWEALGIKWVQTRQGCRRRRWRRVSLPSSTPRKKRTDTLVLPQKAVNGWPVAWVVIKLAWERCIRR